MYTEDTDMLQYTTGDVGARNCSTLDEEETEGGSDLSRECHLSSCIEILLSDSESDSEEEAKKELAVIIKKIDCSYQNAIELSSKYSDSEIAMEGRDQALLENCITDLYNSLFTKDIPGDSFAKLWFSRNFTNAADEEKLHFLNRFFLLIRSAENLYKSKLLDKSIVCKYRTFITDREFGKLNINLMAVSNVYLNTSVTLEEDQKVKDALEKMYFTLFPGTVHSSYTHWVDTNLSGTSSEKEEFIIEAIDMCKKSMSSLAEKIKTHTSGFSGEKFLRLVAFICEELSEVNDKCMDNKLTMDILDSLIKNDIHKLELFKCKKSSNVPNLTYLKNLSSQCVWRLYKSNYAKISKNSVISLLANLASSIGKIHHSNAAVLFIMDIHAIFDIKEKILDAISGHKFSSELRLVLYSQVPKSIRKEMVNILKYQSQKTSMLEELEEEINLAANRKDELSMIINDNVSESDRYATELEESLCRYIISSLEQRNISNDDENPAVVATRSTLDKLKALSRFIENNGGMHMENTIFIHSKDFLSKMEFDFSSLSPKIAHEISCALTNFYHPQAENAKSLANAIANKSANKIYYLVLEDIRNKLIPSKTNDEKFKAWVSINREMEIEAFHIPEEKYTTESILYLVVKELSSKEREDVKKILLAIDAAGTALKYIDNHCRSTIAADLMISIEMWKKSFRVSDNAISKLFAMRKKQQQEEWKRTICESLCLYHHSNHNYFYQVSGTLPHGILKNAQKQCLPNTSNGEKVGITVEGTEYEIPQSVWLDISRSNFIIQEKPIVAGDDYEGRTQNEIIKSLVTSLLNEVKKMDVTSEALASLLSLMNQNTTAQLLEALVQTSAFMFPEESRISSLPSMSKKTIYSATKTPEGELIFTCDISGTLDLLQELHPGSSAKVGDPDYLENVNTTKISPTSISKIPDQSANMKIRINKDGSVDIINIVHSLVDVTPDMIDSLIKAKKDESALCS